ncbi:hypothetical protein M1446_02025 [Candidatus Dependentiae bacterium]|nr:hypothetical protein [Candidatus Dependentiae bacterium]
MKYILKAALFLAAINSINAADDRNEKTSASYFTTTKKALTDFSFRAANFTVDTFNIVKTKSAPYLAIYSTVKSIYNAANQANKAHTYLTSQDFKKQSTKVLDKINTSETKTIIAGTAITLSAGYGLFKYFNNNLQRKLSFKIEDTNK